MVAQRQRQFAVCLGVRALERDGLGRYEDLRPELLRLHEGAAGEGATRDSSGKAQVVLDPRAGAGLPTIGAAVEHDDVQAFRGRIDGGCQARRPGPDHCDIEQLLVLSGIQDSKAARQRGLGRIEHHRAVRTQRQHIGRQRPVLRQQCSRRRIVRGVHHLMRLRVATQERL